jgi:hypothetical protein
VAFIPVLAMLVVCVLVLNNVGAFVVELADVSGLRSSAG